MFILVPFHSRLVTLPYLKSKNSLKIISINNTFFFTLVPVTNLHLPLHLITVCFLPGAAMSLFRVLGIHHITAPLISLIFYSNPPTEPYFNILPRAFLNLSIHLSPFSTCSEKMCCSLCQAFVCGRHTDVLHGLVQYTLPSTPRGCAAPHVTYPTYGVLLP